MSILEQGAFYTLTLDEEGGGGIVVNARLLDEATADVLIGHLTRWKLLIRQAGKASRTDSSDAG